MSRIEQFLFCASFYPCGINLLSVSLGPTSPLFLHSFPWGVPKFWVLQSATAREYSGSQVHTNGCPQRCSMRHPILLHRSPHLSHPSPRAVYKSFWSPWEGPLSLHMSKCKPSCCFLWYSGCQETLQIHLKTHLFKQTCIPFFTRLFSSSLELSPPEFFLCLPWNPHFSLKAH